MGSIYHIIFLKNEKFEFQKKISKKIRDPVDKNGPPGFPNDKGAVFWQNFSAFRPWVNIVDIVKFRFEIIRTILKLSSCNAKFLKQGNQVTGPITTLVMLFQISILKYYRKDHHCHPKLIVWPEALTTRTQISILK